MGRSTNWNPNKASIRAVATTSGIDRISNLPGPLLTRILSLLPTKCAVATCVLSTRWKFLWTSITNLDIDDSGYYPKKKALNVKKIQFTKFVNRVLLLLNPPCIQNFRLKCTQQLADPFYFDSWICAAIGRAFGELDLNFSHQTVELPFSHIYCNVAVLKLEGYINFNIPAQASVCFPNLQTLHLTGINFEISENSSVSFPNLMIVHLNHVHYKNENSVHQLFSSCPVLDDLVIRRDSWDNVLCLIICIPSLTRLKLYFGWFDDDDDEDDDDDDRPYKLQMDKLHNLKSLSLSGHALRAIGTASENISSGFHNLTRLKLEMEDCPDWSIVINNLLENMDNLEHLIMKGERCIEPDHSWWTEPSNVPKCLLSRLTTISFTYMINEDCDELELLSYLLRNAEVLELLTVDTSYASSEEKLKLVEKISLIPRGSRTCQVAFT